MQKHLDNILNDIVLLQESSNYKTNDACISLIKTNVNDLKRCLAKNDFSLIDLALVKKTSELIYQLNYDNDFSDLTDHISNEFYAFEFILDKELQERGV